MSLCYEYMGVCPSCGELAHFETNDPEPSADCVVCSIKHVFEPRDGR